MVVGTQRFHCTTCPSECALTVEVAEDATGALRVISVQGNRCPRGKIFAEQEITCPMRILATTVVVKNGDERLLPVRTANAIPRALHMQAMELVRHASIEAPIHMGDVIMNDVLGTGVDLIASMDRRARRAYMRQPHERQPNVGRTTRERGPHPTPQALASANRVHQHAPSTHFASRLPRNRAIM